eukprot:IDg12323t1
MRPACSSRFTAMLNYCTPVRVARCVIQDQQCVSTMKKCCNFTAHVRFYLAIEKRMTAVCQCDGFSGYRLRIHVCTVALWTPLRRVTEGHRFPYVHLSNRFGYRNSLEAARSFLA